MNFSQPPWRMILKKMIQLKSLSLTDFRSIRGSITVPLDAPVVLIHGQNGTGKTSLLAGIELALTGDVTSFGRFDTHYREHLLHKESDSGHVSVEVTGLPQGRKHGEFLIDRGGFKGSALLNEREAHFYDERCFLAQATLGRLLEIYEDKDARKTASPLTKFVKDLLGLDHLDALIEGLFDAGDVRRFRSAVPVYWETRENIPALQKELERQQAALRVLSAQKEHITRRLATSSERIGLTLPVAAEFTAMLKRFSESPEEAELQRLAAQRRDLAALRTQWEAVSGDIPADEKAHIEARVAATATALNSWKETAGKALEEALNTARRFFSDAPTSARVGPQAALTSTLDLVDAELRRCAAALAQAAQDEQKRTNLSQDIERATARASVLDQQIAQHSGEVGPLAKVLTEMLPHIHTEDCPVCGRDYREVSSKPLQAQVLARISALSERAGQLDALFREKTATANAQVSAERERTLLDSRLMGEKARDDLKTRQANMKQLRDALAALTSRAKEGQDLTVAATLAARAIADLESKDLRAVSVRESMARFETALSLDLIGPADSITAGIDRLEALVRERSAALLVRQAARREAIDGVRELSEVHAQCVSIQQVIDRLQHRIERLKRSQDAGDALIHDARELAKRARAVRTEIVRRVFNRALNTVWKELFVRLAPDELFVPAFALPEDDGGPVEAILETHYKVGGRGGNPRAMLSAGNLNTAALTLFLALHLSVEATLPWLVIDDPIQSMDEVHIAQLAALLRTLSKTQHRQVIIAVHERPLFDYLTLELSPAFPTDRLITIELSRNANGETLMKYEPRVWQPDTAIAA
jgi:DNA repair protein SbcC/Rad50